MAHHSPSFGPRDGASGGGFSSRLRPAHRPPQWLELLARPAVWPAILAVLAAVALLLSFHGVVQGAVETGELRRQAAATQAMQAWRCNTLGDARASDASCLAQRNASAQGGANQGRVTDLFASRN